MHTMRFLVTEDAFASSINMTGTSVSSLRYPSYIDVPDTFVRISMSSTEFGKATVMHRSPILGQGESSNVGKELSIPNAVDG